MLWSSLRVAALLLGGAVRPAFGQLPKLLVPKPLEAYKLPGQPRVDLSHVKPLPRPLVLASLGVRGATLVDQCNQPVVLHGTNFDVVARGLPAQNLALLDEISQSGANAVRLPWRQPASQPAYALANLGLYLQKCQALRLVPVVDFHETTSQGDAASFGAALAFWLAAGTKAVVQPQQKYLLLNIANEWGKVHWDEPNRAANQQNFLQTYQAAIASLRAAGYTCPLLVDAPDGGGSEDVLMQVAPTLLAADPRHNLVFSVHPYWYKYDGQLPHVASQVAALPATGCCFVLGEVANQQDSGPPDCLYNLDKAGNSIQETVLVAARAAGIGWLAWEWHNDACPQRQLTTDGSFSHLTPQGQKLVNDPRFGLAKMASPKACGQ